MSCISSRLGPHGASAACPGLTSPVAPHLWHLVVWRHGEEVVVGARKVRRGYEREATHMALAGQVGHAREAPARGHMHMRGVRVSLS